MDVLSLIKDYIFDIMVVGYEYDRDHIVLYTYTDDNNTISLFGRIQGIISEELCNTLEEVCNIEWNGVDVIFYDSPNERIVLKLSNNFKNNKGNSSNACNIVTQNVKPDNNQKPLQQQLRNFECIVEDCDETYNSEKKENAKDYKKNNEKDICCGNIFNFTQNTSEDQCMSKNKIYCETILSYDKDDFSKTSHKEEITACIHDECSSNDDGRNNTNTSKIEFDDKCNIAINAEQQSETNVNSSIVRHSEMTSWNGILNHDKYNTITNNNEDTINSCNENSDDSERNNTQNSDIGYALNSNNENISNYDKNGEINSTVEHDLHSNNENISNYDKDSKINSEIEHALILNNENITKSDKANTINSEIEHALILNNENTTNYDKENTIFSNNETTINFDNEDTINYDEDIIKSDFEYSINSDDEDTINSDNDNIANASDNIILLYEMDMLKQNAECNTDCYEYPYPEPHPDDIQDEDLISLQEKSTENIIKIIAEPDTFKNIDQNLQSEITEITELSTDDIFSGDCNLFSDECDMLYSDDGDTLFSDDSYILFDDSDESYDD